MYSTKFTHYFLLYKEIKHWQPELRFHGYFKIHGGKKKLVSFLYLCTCTELCQHPIIHVISVIFIISVIPVIPIIPVIPVIWSSGDSGHPVILEIWSFLWFRSFGHSGHTASYGHSSHDNI